MSQFQLNAFRDRRAAVVLAMITLGAVVMPMLGILAGGQRVVLRYIDAVELMHGPQLVLTTKATDMLVLRVSLFAWELDEPDLLRGLATARMALERGENQKVVVECARLSETLLRRTLARDAPDVTKVGGKVIEKATLGELIQANRNHGRLGRFEENVLAAINERRKKIHAIEELGPIDDQDGFFVFTLMEIAMRSRLLTKRS